MISITVTLLEFLAVYFGWLCFPTFFLCLYLIKKKRIKKTSYCVLILCLLFFWAHYIEPYILLVKEKTIANMGFNADIILVSDIHLGYYKDQNYLQKIVDKINEIPADYVVIAGDFFYKANPTDYKKLLAPLAKINKPTYAVRGNHDEPYEVTQRLPNILKELNITLIEKQIIDLNTYQLAGLADRLEASDDASFLSKAAKKPILAVAHNPDSSDQLASYNVSLLLAGHTHCGQIRLPFITDQLVIKTFYGFTCGYYDQTKTGTPVFVTAGVGENNLPLRLFNPPTIDVLHLRP